MIMMAILIILCLGLMLAVTIEIARMVKARGALQKAADAAALATCASVDMPFYRETGTVRYLPAAWDRAQQLANANAGYLTANDIGVTVTGISLDAGAMMCRVSVTADLSGLLPGFLDYSATTTMVGYAKARLQSGQ